MDGHSPLNLILAVAAASATVFLGFLPTKSIRSDFFGRGALIAGIVWMLIAFGSDPSIVHYLVGNGLICVFAWWKFRNDLALSGKMWLSIASGLGISVGVMVILAKSPAIYPPELPPVDQSMLLASIYLGGSVLGLGCVCLTLIQNVSSQSGVTQVVVRRYVGILLGLLLARLVVLWAHFVFVLTHPELQGMPAASGQVGILSSLPHSVFNPHEGAASITQVSPITFALLGVVTLVLPVLGFLSWHATRLHSRFQPTQLLFGLIFFGLLAEVVARLLVL